VKERICGCIFLQVHLVHVFQSFDPHGGGGLVVSVLVDRSAVIAWMLIFKFGAFQRECEVKTA
jgi:hypothetical protein